MRPNIFVVCLSLQSQISTRPQRHYNIMRTTRIIGPHRRRRSARPLVVTVCGWPCREGRRVPLRLLLLLLLSQMEALDFRFIDIFMVFGSWSNDQPSSSTDFQFYSITATHIHSAARPWQRQLQRQIPLNRPHETHPFEMCNRFLLKGSQIK